ncbi:MAG: hypothetical protein HQL81_07065 [Magnetococcales bacterium]|nr:hypothetical protein [Magnetococcales bacterium]
MKGGIFCAVSGHGYGHLSQIAPILDQLGTMNPDLRIMVAGNLDRGVVERFVHVRHEFDHGFRDIGLVQSDPMVVDLEATRFRYEAMQQNWEERVEAEMSRISAWSTSLVLVDIPCVTIAAAHRLGIPSVAVASLSWDHVIKAYFSLEDPAVMGWWRRMREHYAKVTLALHPEPAIVGDTFPRFEVIPPLVSRAQVRKESLRGALGIASDDRRPLVMINLGGMPSHAVPLEQIIQELRYHWLFKETELPSLNHVHSTTKVHQWPFEDVLASVDAVVSKPGYGTAIGAAAQGVALLYVRRGRFPDEDPICNWLSRNARAREIDTETFASGRWHEAMQSLFHLTPPSPPRCDGAVVAAERIVTLMGR